MNDLLNKLMHLVDGVQNEKEMLFRLAIGGVLLAMFILFRNQISKAFSYIVCSILFAKSEKAKKAIMSSVQKPLSYFMAVMGIYLSIEVIFPVASAHRDSIHTTLLVLIKICFIMLSAWFGVNVINSDYSITEKLDTTVATKSAVKFINNFLKWAIIVIAVLLSLEQFGISATKLFTALGIGGVAVAFACKDMVENMLSGFIIIFDKPFDVGDFIEVNGEKGSVSDIKIRTTRLVGVDGCEKVFPNTTMANATITNWTKMNKRAISADIAVTYSSTADKLSETCEGIKSILNNNENVLKDDIRVNFTQYGDHALLISMFFYVDKVATPDYLELKNSINLELKKYFDDNNVELAFESKTVYFGDALKIEK